MRDCAGPRLENISAAYAQCMPNIPRLPDVLGSAPSTREDEELQSTIQSISSQCICWACGEIILLSGGNLSYGGIGSKGVGHLCKVSIRLVVDATIAELLQAPG